MSADANRAAARRITFGLLAAARVNLAARAALGACLAVLLPVVAETAVAQTARSNAARAQPIMRQPDLAPARKARLAETDAFQDAVVKNDAAALKRLLARGAKPDFNFNEAYDGRSGESPLTMAIGRGHLGIARILLDAGADPNRRDGFDQSPLERARSAEAVGLLLAHRADLNAYGRRGLSALDLAVERRDTPTVQILIAHGARFEQGTNGPDRFLVAAQRGDTAMMRSLVAAGADPRHPPTKAIVELIDRGDDAATVKLLLDAGADREARDQWNQTLVERALFGKRWAIVRVLADAEAPLQAADEPACMEAAWKCHSIQATRLATLDPPTLAYLKARGLDVNRKATNGLTALNSLLLEPAQPRVAAVMPDGRRGPTLEPPQELPRIRALLENGADANLRYGALTPVMLAILARKPPALADAIVDFGGRVDFEYTIVKASADDVPKPYGASPGGGVPRAALDAPPISDLSGVLKGRTIGPLTWLVLYRRADLAARILARDRKLPAADRYLLYFAGMLGDWNLVLEALPYTREVDAGDRAGVTPLLIASEDGRADAAQALIAAGANVNARSDRDWPPLWEAPLPMLFMGHSPSKPRLVGGYTPLRIARERGRDEVVRLLVAAGAKE